MELIIWIFGIDILLRPNWDEYIKAFKFYLYLQFVLGWGWPIAGQDNFASSFTAKINFWVNAATDAGDEEPLGLSATNSDTGPSPCRVLAVTQKV